MGPRGGRGQSVDPDSSYQKCNENISFKMFSDHASDVITKLFQNLQSCGNKNFAGIWQKPWGSISFSIHYALNCKLWNKLEIRQFSWVIKKWKKKNCEWNMKWTLSSMRYLFNWPWNFYVRNKFDESWNIGSLFPIGSNVGQLSLIGLNYSLFLIEFNLCRYLFFCGLKGGMNTF